MNYINDAARAAGKKFADQAAKKTSGSHREVGKNLPPRSANTMRSAPSGARLGSKPSSDPSAPPAREINDLSDPTPSARMGETETPGLSSKPTLSSASGSGSSIAGATLGGAGASKLGARASAPIPPKVTPQAPRTPGATLGAGGASGTATTLGQRNKAGEPESSSPSSSGGNKDAQVAQGGSEKEGGGKKGPGKMMGKGGGIRKTRRNLIIINTLLPFIAIAVVFLLLVGIMQSVIISSSAAGEGGSDSVDFAVKSGIDPAVVQEAYTQNDTSGYSWTLTLAWNETMKNSQDVNLQKFPATKFKVAMDEVDPGGEYRDMFVGTVLNGEENGGGLKIPLDEKDADGNITASAQAKKDKQDKIREAWVRALVIAGTPEGGGDPQDVNVAGSTSVIFGDQVTKSASTELSQSMSGLSILTVDARTMSSLPVAIQEVATGSELRPYVIIAAAQTEAATAESLDAVMKKIGSAHSVVFVTGYDPSQDWMDESNQFIRDLADSHSNVRIADWATTVEDSGYDDWFAEDGTSLATDEAKTAYADLISSTAQDLPRQKTTPGLTEKQAQAIYDRAVTIALGTGMTGCAAPSQVQPGGGSLDDKQKQYAVTAMGVAKGMFPDDDAKAKQAAIIAIMTIAVESGFQNYANSMVPESLAIPHDAVGSDHDSVGLIQQRPQSGWGDVGDSTWAGGDRVAVVTRLMTPSYSIGKFIVKLSGLENWMVAPRGDSAQTVQVSAVPDAYAMKEAMAQKLVEENWSTATASTVNPDLNWNGSSGTGSTPGSGVGSIVGNPCGLPLGNGTMGVGSDPVPMGMSQIFSVYGPRDCSDGISSCFHEGLDFSGASGTSGTYCTTQIPINSVSDGIVSLYPDPNYGANNALAVQYSEQLTFYYLHMNAGDVLVKQGDSVKAGQQLGWMGSVGNSTGCHLHLETHVNGETTDPVPILEQGFGIKLPWP